MLVNLSTSLEPAKDYTSPDNPLFQPFVFCLHDWLAHLTFSKGWWVDYDTSLTAILCERVSTSHPLIKGWVDHLIHQALTLQSLLYRQYLILDITNKEIYPTPDYEPLYILMASMLTTDQIFTPLYAPHLWVGIDEAVHPINELRLRRPLLHRYIRTLDVREDVTDHRLIRDHGLISSYTLLYGLYLTRVILIHEHTVHPHPVVQAMLTSVSGTLTQIKGVFENVESHWLSLDV